MKKPKLYNDYLEIWKQDAEYVPLKPSQSQSGTEAFRSIALQRYAKWRLRS